MASGLFELERLGSVCDLRIALDFRPKAPIFLRLGGCLSASDFRCLVVAERFALSGFYSASYLPDFACLFGSPVRWCLVVVVFAMALTPMSRLRVLSPL